jgi:hypothetical protein
MPCTSNSNLIGGEAGVGTRQVLGLWLMVVHGVVCVLYTRQWGRQQRSARCCTRPASTELAVEPGMSDWAARCPHSIWRGNCLQ